MFRIRIHRVHMFLALPSPHPDPLVRGTDPDQNVTDPQHWFPEKFVSLPGSVADP
jgi:hypothetical protein